MEAAAEAITLLALTATRPGEVRNATFDEFDLDAAVWTIPAARYKTGTEFRVPLSERAIELRTEARNGTDGDGLVFPSPVTGRAVSENTYVKLLRDLDIPSSAHGLRATFRTWCSDVGVPRDLAEMALGHVVSGVEGAYARSDMLERRRTLMQQWNDYLA